MIYERVISDFDRHIGMERRYYGDLENRPSYWKKKIFVSSFNFQISDWKGICSEQPSDGNSAESAEQHYH